MTRSRDLDFGLTNPNPAKQPRARHDLMRGHKTLKGGFLELLFMLHDYKESAVDRHARNKKLDTTLVVVSLKSLRGARFRNKQDEAKNDLQAFL